MNTNDLTRRDFVRNTAGASAALAAASTLGLGRSAFAAGKDKIRVGVIGTGGRGTGAAINCAEADDGVVIAALGDLFEDRLKGSRNRLAKSLGDRFVATDDTCFVGFDAYQKVIDSDVDLVILTTSPGFRPLHFQAAVKAGKHVFMEKPVAVDPVGIRKVIAAGEEAKRKRLGVVAGTQRRHQAGYIEGVRAIHEDNILGEIVSGNVYWQSRPVWDRPRQKGWTDMHYQCYNWYYFNWVCGDHICEQHVHQLDVMMWVMGQPPVKAYGNGGRQCRKTKGEIYDHFSIEFEFAGGKRITSMCRQIHGTRGRVSEHFTGAKGTVSLGGASTFRDFKGKGIARIAPKGGASPYVQEHINLIRSVRAGKPLNEARQVAESTMCAIMGRMAAYTGQEVTWDFAMNQSRLDLTPERYAWGPAPKVEVAMPGTTKLI